MKKKLRRIFIFLIISIPLLFLAFTISIYLILFTEVRRSCNKATHEYSVNCRDALIKTFQSDDSSIKEKNDAIWTLGQLADKRSLPFLKSIYKDEIPDREPLDKVISQYEIRKAIKWSEKGNWTSWMYFKYN